MNRIKNILLWLFLIPLALTAQEKQVPIMAWSGIPSTEINLERYLEMKEMGINIHLSTFQNADAMQKGLELSSQAGIKLIGSCPELKSDMENTVKRFKNHPALYGWFLRDEPVRKDFAELGEWAGKIRAVDAGHTCFVNLISSINPHKTNALGTGSYAEYVSTFAKEVPVGLLSFDFYPVLNVGLHEFWYEGLGIFSAEAQKLDKPFWAFALASSYNELHPVPTVAALRLQLFSNLCYGAQGLEFWSYWQSDGLRSAPISQSGKRTVVYDRIKTVTHEIQALSGVFTGSKLVSVFHTGTVIPRGTTRLSALPSAIRVFEPEEPGVLVSTLENGDVSYWVILNRDLEKTQKVIVSGNASLKRVLNDGTVVNADRYDATIEIEPGDVAIFQFPTQK